MTLLFADFGTRMSTYRQVRDTTVRSSIMRSRSSPHNRGRTR